jgi:hypothetical protein
MRVFLMSIGWYAYGTGMCMCICMHVCMDIYACFFIVRIGWYAYGTGMCMCICIHASIVYVRVCELSMCILLTE